MPGLNALDHTPIDTDFDDFFDLLVDMRKFAKATPTHKFINADDPGFHHEPQRVGRLGWSAYIEGVEREDEKPKYWTITLTNAKKAMRSDRGHILRKVMASAEGRRRMLQELVDGARSSSG